MQISSARRDTISLHHTYSPPTFIGLEPMPCNVVWFGKFIIASLVFSTPVFTFKHTQTQRCHVLVHGSNVLWSTATFSIPPPPPHIYQLLFMLPPPLVVCFWNPKFSCCVAFVFTALLLSISLRLGLWILLDPSIHVWHYSPFRALASPKRCLHFILGIFEVFLTNVFMGWGFRFHTQPPTWRTMVFLLM
jgi:hypothetical protein